MGPFNVTQVDGPDDIPAAVLARHKEHFKCPALELPALGAEILTNGFPRLRHHDGSPGTVVGYSHGEMTRSKIPFITVYIRLQGTTEVIPCAPECCYPA
jgi:hypothetical protein